MRRSATIRKVLDETYLKKSVDAVKNEINLYISLPQVHLLDQTIPDRGRPKHNNDSPTGYRRLGIP